MSKEVLAGIKHYYIDNKLSQDVLLQRINHNYTVGFEAEIAIDISKINKKLTSDETLARQKAYETYEARVPFEEYKSYGDSVLKLRDYLGKQRKYTTLPLKSFVKLYNLTPIHGWVDINSPNLISKNLPKEYDGFYIKEFNYKEKLKKYKKEIDSKILKNKRALNNLTKKLINTDRLILKEDIAELIESKKENIAHLENNKNNSNNFIWHIKLEDLTANKVNANTLQYFKYNEEKLNNDINKMQRHYYEREREKFFANNYEDYLYHYPSDIPEKFIDIWAGPTAEYRMHRYSSDFYIENFILDTYNKFTNDSITLRDNNYTKTSITSDESIKPEGIEIVSPIFKSINEAWDWCSKLFDYIDHYDALSTNETTGFHINIGTWHGEQRDNFDVLKLLLILDDENVVKLFSRIGNEYVYTVRDIIGRILNSSDYHGIEKESKTDAIYLKKFIQKINHIIISRAEHYDVASFTKFKNRGYIEFRATGNANYHKRRKEIRSALIKFIKACEAAADPKILRREYLEKLYKVFFKQKPSVLYASPSLNIVEYQIRKLGLQSFIENNPSDTINYVDNILMALINDQSGNKIVIPLIMLKALRYYVKETLGDKYNREMPYIAERLDITGRYGSLVIPPWFDYILDGKESSLKKAMPWTTKTVGQYLANIKNKNIRAKKLLMKNRVN